MRILTDQLDYIFFFYGFAFILLAAVCLTLVQRPQQRLPWAWLGLFGLFHGLNEWMDLVALSLGEGPICAAVHLFLMAVSFACLLEFGRVGFVAVRGKGPGRWILGPLLALAALGGLAGRQGFNAADRYATALVGGLWAALALWVAFRAERGTNRTLRAAAFAMATYALTTGGVVPRASFFPASVLNHDSFLGATGVPVQLLRATAAVVIASTLWQYAETLRQNDILKRDGRAKVRYPIWISLTLITVLACGWMATEWHGRQRYAIQAKELIKDAMSIAGAINPRRIKSLAGSENDPCTAEYQRLREQLSHIGKNVEGRWIDLVQVKNGTARFIADSVAEGEPGHFAPGSQWRSAPAELQSCRFPGEAAFVAHTGAGGKIVSAFATVYDFDTQEALAVLGVHVPASQFNAGVASARLLPIGVTCLCCLLLITGALHQQRIKESKDRLESAYHELAWLLEAAQAATRAKSEFLANMSHEIRTPMTAILGYADVLLTEEEDERAPPHRREALETIKRNGGHLLGLINDILDLSKVESGKMEVERVRCSPFALLEEVASLMRVRAIEKAIHLKTETVGPLPETVLTDPLRLRQVLVNLVGNAIKFTDQGEVRVAARLVCDGGTQRLCFDVIDTGIGMNEEQIAKLFQPFSQVDSSASRKFGGTGLGLAISKCLAESLGGTIEVRSTPGKGSTFGVTIDPGPLDSILLIEQSEAIARPTSPVATPGVSGTTELLARVLLAEDGPDNQRLVSFLLQKAGAEVTTVENGRLALEVALAHGAAGCPFDVILMDMQMPVMDGYTATRQLRQQGYASPIIALTAHAMVEDRRKCLDAGCDDFATKPIDRHRLLEVVSRWAAQAASDRASRLLLSPLA